jgi:LysR family transcriptional activator of nhaA
VRNFALSFCVLNFNHLFYFFTIARLGSLSDSAKFLHLSQPALSIQIKTLELKLNRKLFKKEGRRLVLTSEGERVFHYCQAAFEPMHSLEEYLDSNPARAHLNFAICQEMDSAFAVGLLRYALKKDGADAGHSFSLISDSYGKLIESCECDLVLTSQKHACEDLCLIGELSFHKECADCGSRESISARAGAPVLRHGFTV